MRENDYRLVKMLVGDKKRDITVYSPESLHAQRLLLQKIQPELNKRIHGSAHGYVHGRSTWSAVGYIQKRLRAYPHYLICDIKSFFPSIDRKRLYKMLESILKVSDVSDVMTYVTCCESGIAQGSPLSPVISNCYLFELDRTLCVQPRTTYIRYADDLIVLSDDPSASLRLLKEQLDLLRLHLHEKKVRVGETKGVFEYLGFECARRGLRIALEKQKEMNLRMHLASPGERKAVFQGYQAYYRSTTHLHPDADTLRWVLSYAPLLQSANYVRQFSKSEWQAAQAVLESLDQGIRTWTSATVMAPMGRVLHKESVHIAG